MLRPGDNVKLSAEAEQAHLDALRAQREAKARYRVQVEAQSLAMTLGDLSLDHTSDLLSKAKELSELKVFGNAGLSATTAILFNIIVRNGVPPKEDEADSNTPRGKKGGSKHKSTGVKAAAAKLVDRPPCTAAEARKAVKANKGTLAATAKTPVAQAALCEAVEAWLLSAHGSVALPGAAKVIEVLYDLDLASDAVLTQYWGDAQASVERDVQALEEAKTAVNQQQAVEAAAAAAVGAAEAEQKELTAYKKASEQYAQAARCGGNPNKDEEAAEKAALAQLKKAIELHTQSLKVLAARQKTHVAESATLEEVTRTLAERQAAVDRRAPFVKHAAPFFEWLAASDDEDED